MLLSELEGVTVVRCAQGLWLLLKQLLRVESVKVGPLLLRCLGRSQELAKITVDNTAPGHVEKLEDLVCGPRASMVMCSGKGADSRVLESCRI